MDKSRDLVVADMDGVLIVPQKIEEEVIVKSLEKVRAEKKVREENRKWNV